MSCPETYGKIHRKSEKHLEKTMESQRFDFDEVDEGEKHFETPGCSLAPPDTFRGQVVLLKKS